MTPEAQRIALAKAFPDWTVHHGGKYCSITNCSDGPLKGRLFDPLNYLNAMHEAVQILTPDQRHRFVDMLWVIVNAGTHWDDGRLRVHFFNYVNATAAQRAEAFLKTLGLWKEDE